jgi:transmembrane sensor
MNTNVSAAEQAIAWFTRSRGEELSALESQQFVGWLIESPLHVREYLETAKVWGALQSAVIWPRDSREDFLQLVSEAAQRTNPVSLASAMRVQEAEPPRRSADSLKKRSRPRPLYAVAAGVLALTSAILVWFYGYAKPATYETVRGEQRYVVLPDGSSVQLNTLTRLVVRFDERQRRIELPQGEALFRVARDPARPFEVTTPHARVRALGTEFNVYNRREGTRVAVIEGKVRVVSAAKSPQAVESGSFLDLNPQQAADVDTHGQVAAVQPAQATHRSSDRSESGWVDPEIAWVRRRIVLDGDRVASAVEEFNRYNAKQIRIEDPALAGLRITGVFNADEPAALLKYLREIRPLEVTETAGELRVHR